MVHGDSYMVEVYAIDGPSDDEQMISLVYGDVESGSRELHLMTS